MEGRSVISDDVLARYAGDAAREVQGVRGLVDGQRPGKRAVRIHEDDHGVAVEVSVELCWGANAGDVGERVQGRVAEYLGRMADVRLAAVDVSVSAVAPPLERP